MIRQVVVDDLDGTEGATKVMFGWEGVIYELDLAEDNRAKLRVALEPFIRSGRPMPLNKFVNGSKVTKAAPKKALPSATPPIKTAPKYYRSGVDYDVTHLRQWADKNGQTYPKRGAMPTALVEQYLASQTRYG